MKIRFLLIFIITIFSSNGFSINIRVIDFQKVIDNNTNINFLYDQINIDQLSHKKKFKNEELDLQKELERIEKLNLILETSELEKEIENYNQQLNIFNEQIKKFNIHYELQINNLKNKLINIVLELLKKYSEDNKIDLILDSTNYIISSNSINITNIIQDQLNNKTIETSFEKY